MATKTLRVSIEVYEKAVSLAQRLGINVSEAIERMTQHDVTEQRDTKVKQAVSGEVTESQSSTDIQPYEGDVEGLVLENQEGTPTTQCNNYFVLSEEQLHALITHRNQHIEEVLSSSFAPLLETVYEIEAQLMEVGHQLELSTEANIQPESKPKKISYEELTSMGAGKDNVLEDQKDNSALLVTAGLGVATLLNVLMGRR